MQAPWDEYWFLPARGEDIFTGFQTYGAFFPRPQHLRVSLFFPDPMDSFFCGLCGSA
jgi:hypothetical protein